MIPKRNGMKRNETDSKKINCIYSVSFRFCEMETLFRYVPCRLKKKISVSFRFGKNSCMSFRSFSFRYCFVSFPLRFGKIWRVFRFISFRFKPFLFESVPFCSVPFLLNVRGFPFRTVSLLSNLFRFVLFPDNIYRFLFPSVPFHKFCLSCCSDATCHIQHS